MHQECSHWALSKSCENWMAYDTIVSWSKLDTGVSAWIALEELNFEELVRELECHNWLQNVAKNELFPSHWETDVEKSEMELRWSSLVCRQSIKLSEPDELTNENLRPLKTWSQVLEFGIIKRIRGISMEGDRYINCLLLCGLQIGGIH